MSDLVSDIWAKVVTHRTWNLMIAEDRSEIDRLLLGEIEAISDPNFRGHVTQMLKEKRLRLFHPEPSVFLRIERLEKRVSELEAAE